mgnify:FL=1
MRANGHSAGDSLGGDSPIDFAGRPSVDFSTWKRESLNLFARDAYLRILELEDTLQAVMTAYRAEVKKNS